MLDEGREAPTFALPGVVDGEPRTVDVADAVGDGILILAFYPGDFNPACDDDSCGLTELDLFEMQRDVDIYAISPDSVFSHRAFAAEYSLSIPLLSDTHGEAIDAYDVRLDSDQLLAQRAVFVIDQDGIVQYAWATDDLAAPPDVDAVRAAVADIGGDSTAVGRYRVGHAHYIEGRRAFTSAMDSYESHDWLIARGDFQRAMEEFQESADQFGSAIRFAESEPLEAGFERARKKATSLWQAAEWLADSADEYGSGNGKAADEYRQDAESPLEAARDIGEPPDPDDIDLDAPGAVETEAETDDTPALQTPSDPAETAQSTSPGGDGAEEPDKDDIDAALEAVEAADESADSNTADRTGDGESDAEEDEETTIDDDVELDLSDPTE